MPRARGRATQNQIDALHKLTAKALTRELRAALKGTNTIPAALLAQAIKFITVNGADTPAPSQTKVDRLAKQLPSFDDLNSG